MSQPQPLLEYIYRLHETSSLAIADAVAYSLIVLLFTFYIFLSG